MLQFVLCMFLSYLDLPAKPTIDSVALYEAQVNSILLNWSLSYNGDTPILKFVIQMRQDSSLCKFTEVESEEKEKRLNDVGLV